MNQINYESFYDKVGKTNGWDFSKVKSFSEGISWDFYEEVIKKCESKDILLDIGTGGGESVLKISPSLLLLIGIDLSNGMIKTAQSNLKESNVSNVKFFQMSSEDLQFPNGFFDTISNRHAPFSSKEVFKVLKSKGYFLTQQVSEADKLNIKEAFGRGQAFNQSDGKLKEHYIRELTNAGFSEVKSYEYNATDYFQRPEDLIFLLKHTPIVPNFGHDKKDFKLLNEFIVKNKTEKGIMTNSKRFLIVAKK
ncbi:class I SAM-dependent methyltransferase [Oceanobacillus sp. J11TS1]|uniref:class I SAM-dependent methyltransferase n=1 Tax=Oceanobacillus sp. J11TS1 TaxID=2807191 RepID=UPI001AFD891E|nr:class I SAM-dependent methyltransferase [Oceanobacillus sp. J11TS1]GIO25193.1 methyltransferase [Oceanobacillus sp. J11TS1]